MNPWDLGGLFEEKEVPPGASPFYPHVTLLHMDRRQVLAFFALLFTPLTYIPPEGLFLPPPDIGLPALSHDTRIDRHQVKVFPHPITPLTITPPNTLKPAGPPGRKASRYHTKAPI